MNPLTRRTFLRRAALSGVVSALAPAANLDSLFAASPQKFSAPHIQFPKEPRQRISVASYPFREFIQGKHDAGVAGRKKMELKDFAAHVKEKFQIGHIEPWSEHFLSLDHGYLDQIREGVQKAGGAIANIAADGENSPYSASSEERDRAIAFSKRWIDAAVRIGSPSVRTNIPGSEDTKPDVHRTVESLKHVADYASGKNVAVHLENDNPVSEDPFFLAQVIDEVNSPWIRALPDFGNSFAALSEEEAFRGLEALFVRAYGISHVKDSTTTPEGKVVRFDVARIFDIAAQNSYAGFFSMEWEGQGDPYAGTQSLIDLSVKNLSAKAVARSRF
jgi:sugar phosphate isomerase/epimerase